MVRGDSMTTKDVWPDTINGPLFTRLRRRIFGLNEEEIAARYRLVDEMKQKLLAQSAERDRLFDEWWDSRPSEIGELEWIRKFEEYMTGTEPRRNRG